ncbi:MAG: YraN family protein, partial [Bacteroidota bacterium]
VGEDLAAEFLGEAGLRVLERNYRYGRAEIDIVAEESDELVFVEVKARNSLQFGEPEESVGTAKEANLRRAAEGYCLERGMTERFYRFDIVAIRSHKGVTVVKHIRNAF